MAESPIREGQLPELKVIAGHGQHPALARGDFTGGSGQQGISSAFLRFFSPAQVSPRWKAATSGRLAPQPARDGS